MDEVKDKRILTSDEYSEIFHAILELVPDGITSVVSAIILYHGWVPYYYETKGDGLIWTWKLVE